MKNNKTILVYKLWSFLTILCSAPISSTADTSIPWVVYYSDLAPLSAFSPYQLVILDNESHPPLPPLVEKNKTLLGYLSLGEIGQYRNYFNDVKKQGILLHENKNWPGSFAVDVRDIHWTSRVIEQLIPSILDQGFHGVFIDTLDIPISLQNNQPSRFRGMRLATVNLIKMIRQHYPEITIMVNRAYEILPDIINEIDMVLGESVFTTYNFDEKRYEFVKKNIYRQQVRTLRSIKRKAPHLQILTLDYWNPDDKEGIAKIYTEQRSNGFFPYVATIKLDQIITEPGQ